MVDTPSAEGEAKPTEEPKKKKGGFKGWMNDVDNKLNKAFHKK